MRMRALIVSLLVAVSSPVFARAPPAPPPEPPPRLEASAQFTFQDASGNSSSQSLGAGGRRRWRYSAEPPEGFEKTDRILAVSGVAKMKRPK